MPGVNTSASPLSAFAGVKRSTPIRILLAIGSAVGLSLAFPSYHLPLFAWFSLALLIASVLGAGNRLAGACGFLHGFLFVALSVPWIYTVMRVHGYMDQVTSAGVFALIAAAWGVLTGAFARAVGFLAKQSVTRACLAAPFLWITMEFARLHLPEIAFPWNLSGYPAAENIAFMQLVPLTGIFGLSLIVCGFNALFVWAWTATSVAIVRRVVTVGAIVAVLGMIAIAGPRMVPQERAGHTARLVQLNFPEVPSYPGNWMEIHASEMDALERMSVAEPRKSDVPGKPRPDLIVWPEAPAPFMFLDSKFAARAERIAQTTGRPFLAGVIEWKSGTDSTGNTKLQPYNSAVMLDAQGRRIFEYDKIHLVPFGEYEPFPLIHHVVTSVSQEVGGFRKGSLYAVGQLPGEQHFGVFICYEAIFPNEVRRFVGAGANLLINISNDGWFGRSAAPDQHLLMARVRAAENRRWLLRATNNGYTVSIDPYGRIVARLTPDVRATIDVPYDFRGDITVYSRLGDWVAWLCVIISVVFLFLGWQAARQAVTRYKEV